MMSPHDGADAVRQIISNASDVQPDDDTEIARLASLPPIECDRQVPETAKRLGCLVSTLRRQVQASRRDDAGNSVGQGRALDLYEPEPWSESVDGAALLDGVTTAIRRHVVLGQAEAVTVALWVVATHAFDMFSIFPRLFVTAPEKGCGKSTLLDVLARLVPKPLGASNIKAAALFRTIEKVRPTLLLDEADAYVRDNEDLRSVLDAGHSRYGSVIRCVGEDHEPRQFSVWAPVALAAIGHLAGTIEDRSIRINLRRRRPDESIQPLRHDRTGDLEKLARKAARWAADHAAEIAAIDPAMPMDIINRTADNWRPLLAVADVVGGNWPAQARDAAAALSGDGEDGESVRVLLLADLRDYFAETRFDVLFTAEVLRVLAEKDDRPWPEYRNGKAITSRQLAMLLKPFDIRPTTVRRHKDTDKGYRREWFDDAFARYLPPSSVTTSQPSVSAGFADPRSVTRWGAVTDGNGQKERNSAACDGVTDWTGPPNVGQVGRPKFVYRRLPSGWHERRIQEFHEYREELRSRGLPEEDWWCYPDGVGIGR